MKQINLGIVAHVDAGKTTLNECLLFHGGVIRKMGRVDHQDSYLDYDSLEKDKGITIYAKTAQLTWKDSTITLVDTPGHIDFSGEMERTLRVLDKVVLVISGLDGVQSHSETIWKLIHHYHLPCYVFINKMDITPLTKETLLKDLCEKLDGNFVDFSNGDKLEKLALSSDELLMEYSEKGTVSNSAISNAIENQQLIPVYFGSALKDQGVVELMDDIDKYSIAKKYPEEFGLKIFKVSYDETGTRLCYGKVTGGSIEAKEKITDELKIDQIRLYSGKKFTLLQKAFAGQIVAIKGLEGCLAGYGLGFETNDDAPLLEAYMSYNVILPQGCDINEMLKQLNMLAQEDPLIKVHYISKLKQIRLTLMGEMQIEVIEKVILQRTGVTISFQQGTVLHQETITAPAIGIGHYEPLRHYGEVALMLTPLPRGSGLVFDSAVSYDDLAINYQKQILNALKEKKHLGVLTGSPITDIKITLIAAKVSLKHTDGGDLAQSANRAVRNALMFADSILLEPYFNFEITVQKQYLSKVLYDMEMLKCSISVEENEKGLDIIKGSGPVSKLQNYRTSFLSATSATGKMVTTLKGYDDCLDSEEMLLQYNYDPLSDQENPAGSIFCSHGAGFYVPYDYVKQYAHIQLEQPRSSAGSFSDNKHHVSESELQAVFNNSGGKNKKEKEHQRDQIKENENVKKKNVVYKKPKPRMIIVDGYNVMHSYEKTRNLCASNFDGARDILINDLVSYGGFKGCPIVVVFDAYKPMESVGKVQSSDKFSIVFTKFGQTADSYIEKMVHDYREDYAIVVVTSDMAVQNMALGDGATRMSSREMELELKYYQSNNRNYHT